MQVSHEKKREGGREEKEGLSSKHSPTLRIKSSSSNFKESASWAILFYDEKNLRIISIGDKRKIEIYAVEFT